MISRGDGRWPKGRSGNPRGRPRKVDRDRGPGGLFDQVVRLTQNGVARELGVCDALLLRAVEDAMKGGARATKTVLDAIYERERRRAQQSGSRKALPRLMLVRERDSDNAFEALCILGIAIPRPFYLLSEQATPETPDPDNYGRITIEKWATDEALGRKPRPKLDAELHAKLESMTTGQTPFSLDDDSDDGDDDFRFPDPDDRLYPGGTHE